MKDMLGTYHKDELLCMRDLEEVITPIDREHEAFVEETDNMK